MKMKILIHSFWKKFKQKFKKIVNPINLFIVAGVAVIIGIVLTNWITKKKRENKLQNITQNIKSDPMEKFSWKNELKKLLIGFIFLLIFLIFMIGTTYLILYITNTMIEYFCEKFQAIILIGAIILWFIAIFESSEKCNKLFKRIYHD
jgi:hypothetical protein